MKNTFFTIVISIALLGCGNANENNSQSDTSILDSYLSIKDALIETDAAKAQVAAENFLEASSNTLFKEALEAIAASDDVSIQRAQFENLSIQMYDFVKTNQQETIIYKQYCPMAFNNKGAFWLSTEQQVVNPYYGEMMLNCGSVQETISN